MSDDPDPSAVGEEYLVEVKVGGEYEYPKGSVTVSEGSGSCNTGELVDGAGSCVLISTTPGTKTLTATYSGDGTYDPSSDTEWHTVNRSDSTTTIVSDSPDPSTIFQAYTVAVTVSGSFGTPTGSVSVSDGSTGCTISSLSGGMGSCQIISTSVGSKTLTANYSGDLAYNTSSDTESHTVDKAISTTTITSDTPDPSFVNQMYTVGVTVSGSVGTPSGPVILSDGSASSACIQIVGGDYVCQLTTTSEGAKTLTATYSGSSTYYGSSDTESHTVNKANSTTSITSDNPDPSYVNQAYTVTVNVSGSFGAPTGSVSVTDGSTGCTIASLSSGSGSCQLTSTSVGGKTLTATYSGDSAYNGSTDTEGHSVNKATSNTTITSDNPDPSYVNQAYTVAVTVSGSYGTPTGSVNVSDGSTSCSITSLSGGSGSCQLTSTSNGSKTLTATYGGDDVYNPSSDTEPHTVNKAISTTTITSDNPDPSVVNQPYTVNVTVSGSYGTPTGSVSVNDGSVSCNITSLTAGSGSCQLTSTSSGSKTLTATYAGDSTYNGSSDVEGHTVNKGTSTTTITSDNPDPSFVNQAYTVNVTVSGSYGTPSGTFTVSDGAASCSSSLAGGAGSCLLTSTSSGAKTLTANYYGDSVFNPSSDTESHTVNKASSTTVITSDSPDPSYVNQAYTVAVTVSGGFGTPTGSVTVSDGSATCNIPTLSGSGTGSCQLTSTTSGSKVLSAAYAGDTTYNASSGNASHLVNKSSTATAIQYDNPDPSTIYQAYTVGVIVIGAYGPPTGSVTVSDGSATCNIPTLSGGGTGSCQLTSTSSGSKTLTATYSGDTAYNGSSGTTSHTVNKLASITEITSDAPDPSETGEPYEVEVTIYGTYETPTGTVTVTNDEGDICLIDLDVMEMSCWLTSTLPGMHTVTADYSGDSFFAPSSDSKPHEVSKVASTTTISSDDPDPSEVNQAYTVEVSVDGTLGDPSGTVTVSDGSASCLIDNLSEHFGSCQLTSTTPGSKTLTATFSGDDVYESSSDTEPHMVSKVESTITITSDDPDPSAVGEAYLVEFMVTGLYGTPTGSVEVSDGTDSCGIDLTTSVGSCYLTTMSPGSKTLTASYTGDEVYEASSDTETHTVSKLDSTTEITSDEPDPSYAGEAYEVAVTIYGSYETPTGTIAVTNDDGDSCQIDLDAMESSCWLTSTTVGEQMVTATYSGDAFFEPSFDTESHTVYKLDSITEITSDDPDPSEVGEAYEVAVTIYGTYETPTGTVDVTDGTDSCEIDLASASSCLLTSTTPGEKTLTATYSGDVSFAPSSDTESHTVEGEDIPIPPDGLSATDGKFTDKVRLTWNASSGATYYEVYRNTRKNTTGATLIGSPAATAYNDAGAIAGKVQWYFVKACNDSGCSDYSTAEPGYRALKAYSPLTINPWGTIDDQTPKYKWTKVTDATRYRYQLYLGTKLIYMNYASSSACGIIYCGRTPTTTLEYKKYKWRVSAYVGGVWKPWSAYKYFTIAKGVNAESQ
jgi:hypothetical protein